MLQRFLIIHFLLLGFSSSLFAENGDVAREENYENQLLTIKELTEQGHYLEAILRSEENSNYRPLGEIIAAAKSAWALSLVSSARKYWEQALSHKDCVGIAKARALLALGLIEFQEHNYERSRSLAEEGASEIGDSDLRGELWLLVGESLRAQDLHSLSEGYLEKAALESSNERKQEALLSLAQVQKQLGKLNEARSTLTRIELSSSVTTRALSELVAIDSKAKNSQGVRTWISEGRKSFPSEFSTSETGYNLVRALVSEGLAKDASAEIAKVTKEVHEDDAWFQLSRALVEEYSGREYLESLNPSPSNN